MKWILGAAAVGAVLAARSAVLYGAGSRARASERRERTRHKGL